MGGAVYNSNLKSQEPCLVKVWWRLVGASTDWSGGLKDEYEVWLRDFGLVELTEAETGVCGPQRVETGSGQLQPEEENEDLDAESSISTCEASGSSELGSGLRGGSAGRGQLGCLLVWPEGGDYRQSKEDGGAYQAGIVGTQEKPHGLWGVTNNQAFSLYIF